jgi:hypothetical protein
MHLRKPTPIDPVRIFVMQNVIVNHNWSFAAAHPADGAVIREIDELAGAGIKFLLR